MGINQVIVFIMVAFMIWAAIDKFFLKNKFGYGEKFDEAFSAMGPLALAIVGIMCFAPIMGKILTQVFAPFFNMIGADPAMIAGSVLASDMGGFSLAETMTTNPDIIILSGIYLGSMMGVAIIFVIPYTSTVIEKKDFSFLSKGIMAGIIPIPIGCFIAGLISKMDPLMLIINLIPAAILAVVIALGFWLIPKILTKIFEWFSKILTVLIGVFLVISIIEALTGYIIIPGMDPIGPQLEIVGLIAIVLAGAYPFIRFLTTILSKPMKNLGKVLGVNAVSMAGMLASLASAIPMYPMVKDMDERGKVISIAFSVCAGFVLGDILAYTSARAPEYIFPMIIGKLSAGIIAIFIASKMAKKVVK